MGTAPRSVLKHLEEARKRNEKGRSIVAMTKLEGKASRSEASGFCDRRANSAMTDASPMSLTPKQHTNRDFRTLVLGFGLCTVGLGI